MMNIDQVMSSFKRNILKAHFCLNHLTGDSLDGQRVSRGHTTFFVACRSSRRSCGITRNTKGFVNPVPVYEAARGLAA